MAVIIPAIPAPKIAISIRNPPVQRREKALLNFQTSQ
jgi:hypothetical protein